MIGEKLHKSVKYYLFECIRKKNKNKQYSPYTQYIFLYLYNVLIHNFVSDGSFFNTLKYLIKVNKMKPVYCIRCHFINKSIIIGCKIRNNYFTVYSKYNLISYLSCCVSGLKYQ